MRKFLISSILCFGIAISTPGRLRAEENATVKEETQETLATQEQTAEPIQEQQTAQTTQEQTAPEGTEEQTVQPEEEQPAQEQKYVGKASHDASETAKSSTRRNIILAAAAIVVAVIAIIIVGNDKGEPVNHS